MAKRTAHSSLATLSVTDLQAEIDRRQRDVKVLNRRRTSLLEKLDAINAELQQAGATANGSRTRPRNDSTLPEALAQVLKGRTMGVSEVADAVQKAGYRSTSPSFRTIVNQALIISGKFRRVSRGQYTAK